jgi:hypothetical protein
MAWPKGVSGNPGGRQPGVGRARQLGEALLIRAEDTRSPKAFLLAVMRNEQAHSQLRLAAAIAVAPYCEAKITDPPLETVVPIIECKTAADAQHNIATIAHFEATGRIGHASAAALCARQNAWVEAHIVTSIQGDAKEAIRLFLELRESLKSQGVSVIGGLPPLELGANKDGVPYAAIDMPKGPVPFAGSNKDRE